MREWYYYAIIWWFEHLIQCVSFTVNSFFKKLIIAILDRFFVHYQILKFFWRQPLKHLNELLVSFQKISKAVYNKFCSFDSWTLCPIKPYNQWCNIFVIYCFSMQLWFATSIKTELAILYKKLRIRVAERLKA